MYSMEIYNTFLSKTFRPLTIDLYSAAIALHFIGTDFVSRAGANMEITFPSSVPSVYLSVRHTCGVLDCLNKRNKCPFAMLM